MKLKCTSSAALAALLLSVSLPLGASTNIHNEAVDLYRHGMYAKAMELFRSDLQDPLSYDYSVLCAVKLGLDGARAMVESVDTLHPRTIVNSAIHQAWGLRLFDEEDYRGASAEFAKVDDNSLSRTEKAEFYYKYGYSLYNDGQSEPAMDYLLKVEDMQQSEYMAVTRFTLGTIAYNGSQFSDAFDWFEMASGDERFRLLSEFYMLDCRFMLKNYEYVLREGERLYPEFSGERAKYLSRIMSESYLVLGNAAKAQEYFDREAADISNMSDEDIFHAASVHYANSDYVGALSYFTRMPERLDSLGQIALYQMGDSYIQVKNKVAAMDAFRRAGAMKWSETIREDALFNYAKLAFDLNQDPSVFESYLKEYSTSRRGEMIYGYLALSALLRKDFAAAVDAYDQIDELTPEQKSNYVKANFLRADQLLSIGSYRDAVPYLKASAYYLPRTDKFNQFARYHLADSYYRSGMYKEALGVYTDLYNISALNNTREGALIPYNMGYCCLSAGDYDAAAKWYDTYLRSGDRPARKDAMLRRADCDFIRRHYTQAVMTYNAAVQEYPDTVNLYASYQLGMAAGLAGNLSRKIDVLTKAAASPVGARYYSDVVYELGRACIEAGKCDEAVAAFEKLQACASDNVQVSRALVGKGLALKNAGRYDDAFACYDKVVKMSPRNEYFNDALLSISSICEAQQHPEKYLEYVEAGGYNAGQSTVEKEKLYFNTAEQVFLAGNYSGTVTYAKRYLSLYPEGPHIADAYYYMAEAYRHIGNKEAAIDAYGSSLEADASGAFSTLSLMQLASLCYALERFEDAYDAYEKVGNLLGMMRSAYNAKLYDNAIQAAVKTLTTTRPDEDVRRECLYIQAKSYLATSRRTEAFDLLTKLMEYPDSPEGAEAWYLVIKSRFDWGRFDSVEEGVYEFASKCQSQPYWLAKAFVVLGDAFIERGNTAQAKVTFESVRDGFTPSSSAEEDVIETVKEKLEQLNS